MKNSLRYLLSLVMLSVSLYATPDAPDLTSTDSGASSTDNITNVNDLTFSGSKYADENITLYRDGVKTSYVDNTTNTSYSIIVYNENDGEYEYSVTANDGSESSQSDTITVIVDTRAPTITIGLDAASDSGSSSTDTITNVTTPTFSGTVNEPSAIVIDGTNYSSSSTWTHTHSALVGTDVGSTYSIGITATDVAGNVGSASRSVTIDTSASISFASISSVINSSSSYLDNGLYVSLNTDIESTITKTITIDSTLTFNITSGSDIFINSSDLLSLSDGRSYSIEVPATKDIAGNIATAISDTFTYDITGNEKTYAKPISVGSSLSENLYPDDIDYFVLNVLKKGELSISTNQANANIILLTLDDSVINDPVSNSLTQLVDAGSYLVKVSGTYTGDYTLTSSINEFAQEIDISAIPNGVSTFLVNHSANFMSIDGDILYTSSGGSYSISNGTSTNNLLYSIYSNNKFFVKNGNYIYVEDSSLYVKSVLNGQSTSSLSNNSLSVQSLSVVNDTAYMLVGATLEVFDLSNLGNLTRTTTITLPTIQNSFDEIIVYEKDTTTYLYAQDTSGTLYIYDMTDTANIVLLKYFDNLNLTDYTIDNNLLYVASSNGVYIFDILNDAGDPKLLSKIPGYITAIAVSNSKLFINDGSNIYSYNITYDYEDAVVSELTLSRMNLNDTTTMNNFSSKNDIDIFRVDLENSGTLSFTSSGVDSNDLNITIDDNSDFSSPEQVETDFINKTITLNNIQAKTYYVKIESSDTNTYDEYTLENTFVTVTSDDAKDAVLNSTLIGNDEISLNTQVTASLDSQNNDNDIDIYKIVLPSDGELTLTNTGTKTVALYSADINTTSSYASLSVVSSLSPIEAGTYYIQVSGVDGAYTITPTFVSFADTDEHSASLSVANISEISINTALENLSINEKLINTPYYSDIRSVTSTLFTSATSKEYLSQLAYGKYIYALYRNSSTILPTVEIGIDVFEYINDSNVRLVSNKVVEGAVSTTFAYTIKLFDDTLIVREDINWIEYDISNPLSIVDTNTTYLDATYTDFEVDSTTIYAVNTTQVTALDKATKEILKTKSLSDITSVAIYDGVVYVSTSSNGIKALQKDDLSLLKEITNIKDTDYLENIGNTLYSAVYGESTIKTISIQKDFGDDFSNAFLLVSGNDVTGQIDSSTDKDFFKINLDFTGSLDTTLSAGDCKLYDSDLNEITSGCTQVKVASGRYYFEISNNTTASYILHVTQVPLSSDIQDTVRFYDNESTNVTDSAQSFDSSIDIAGDVDYFKIIIDTTGLLTLDVTNDKNISLVYENGYPVELINGKYNVVVSGEYFIKVTSDTEGTYSVSSSFESIADDSYIDNAIAQNPILSTLALSGEFSKIISSGDVVYLVDEVDGLSIIDVSDVEEPKILSRVNMDGTPTSLYLDGSILYVAMGENGFGIVDVSDTSSPFLYSQVSTNETAYFIAAKGSTLFVASYDSVKKYDISNPINPLMEDELVVSLSGFALRGDSLLVSIDQEIQVLSQSDFTKTDSVSLVDPYKIYLGVEYIFVENAGNNMYILDTNLSDTGVVIDNISNGDTNNLNDVYINNKILYIATKTSYSITEFKNLESVLSSTYAIEVNSITFARNAILLAKPKELSALEATADYVDTLVSQNINLIDIGSTNSITGQFSRKGDIDSFQYTNIDYTGTFELNVTAGIDVNITMYDAQAKKIGQSAINSIKNVINSGDIYIQITPLDDSLFSYEFSHKFTNDGVLDIMDENYNNEEVYVNNTIDSNLYSGGYDKDYFKLIIQDRGTVSFDLSDNKNVKVSLLYKSGTVIASNYDENNDSIKSDFKADLSAGEYFLLVENADTDDTTTQDYSISTSLSSLDEISMDSGVSITPLDSLKSFAYLGSHSFMLKDAELSRMSNILETKQKIYINEIDTTNNTLNKIFAYNQGDDEALYISQIDLDENNLNTVIKVIYEMATESFYRESNFFSDMSGITDEEILFIDSQEYIYYYDEDSLYISALNNTEEAQQLALEDLKLLEVKGDYMYLVTSRFIQIVDVSDKQNINDAKILDTINVDNAQSIYIDKEANRLFIGANDKIEIWNISDKTSATQISESVFNLEFNEKDLWYKGTPTSFYMIDDNLYTTVDGIGLLFFKVNAFNELEIFDKVLNLGENLTDIYTFRGDAINYVVDNELKVYFYNGELLDADSSGSYNVIQESSVSEGSKVVEGCFIATAAYGSYFNTHVKTLRDFRDHYLLTNELGRVFVSFYYEHSPSIAKSIQKSEVAKSFVRVALMPIVYMITYPFVFAFTILILLFIVLKARRKNTTIKLGSI